MKPLRVATAGVPDYLTRHFWWAYMWPKTAWFFDHPLVITSILFGNYGRLKRATLRRVARVATEGRMLQLTCVYGKLTPRLLETIGPRPLHITDIVPLQLELTRRKTNGDGELLATRMNAEQLAYRDDSFSTLLIFFLLHELPEEARRRVLSESLRVLEPGATLVLTEYGARPEQHLLHRLRMTRRLLVRAEPFLDCWWDVDIPALLEELAEPLGKTVVQTHVENHFGGFYRVCEYQVLARD